MLRNSRSHVTKFGPSRDPGFVASFQLEFTSMLSRSPPPAFNLAIPASATGVWDRYCPGTGKLTADRYYRFRAAPNHCNSYVVLDERLRLLDCSTGGKLPSSMSVVEDVHAALAHIGFDDVAFRKRDGNFFSS